MRQLRSSRRRSDAPAPRAGRRDVDQMIGEVEVADLDRIRIAIDVLEAERRFCKRSSLCRVAPVVLQFGARCPEPFQSSRSISHARISPGIRVAKRALRRRN